MTGPSSAGLVKGWCPTLLTPMEAGDGLLVRVKPRAATLTAGQAEAMAAAAGQYGNGIVEPTNRGHFQVRGLSAGTVDDFAGAMAQIGLAAADPQAEAVRNILADPLGPDDPAARFDSHALARRLSAILETDPALRDLPGKFGLLVDAGVALPLAGCTADIMVRSGGEGATIALAGGDRLLALPESAVEEAVCCLLAAFLSWTNGQGEAAALRPAGPSSKRMKAMVAGCGAGSVFDAAGLHGELRRTAGPEPAVERPRPGFVPVADAAQGYFAIAAPFGCFEAGDLAVLAGLSQRYADGTIRVTPWKSVILWDVSPSGAVDILNLASERGLIAEPDDPRGRIVACAGRPRCAHGHADSRADAAGFAAALPRADLLHVSGCAKGCAHPAPAAATLVAGPGGYDLVRNGRAGDAPEFTNLTREAAVQVLTAPNSAAPNLAASNPAVSEPPVREPVANGAG